MFISNQPVTVVYFHNKYVNMVLDRHGSWMMDMDCLRLNIKLMPS